MLGKLKAADMLRMHNDKNKLVLMTMLLLKMTDQIRRSSFVLDIFGMKCTSPNFYYAQ